MIKGPLKEILIRVHNTEQWCAWDVMPREMSMDPNSSCSFPGCIDPCQLTEVRSRRSTNLLAVCFLIYPIPESDDLHEAHKSEVKRVKRNSHIFFCISLLSLNQSSGVTTVAWNFGKVAHFQHFLK